MMHSIVSEHLVKTACRKKLPFPQKRGICAPNIWALWKWMKCAIYAMCWLFLTLMIIITLLLDRRSRRSYERWICSSLCQSVPLVLVPDLMVGTGYAIYSLSDRNISPMSSSHVHEWLCWPLDGVVLWGIRIYLFLLAIVLSCFNIPISP